MPVRNGILTTLRARGRSLLFTFLILVLTVSLSLGLGMWAYCGGVLEQMDEEYTSVALVEYMGEDYPDANAADAAARAALEKLDEAALAAVDGVRLWERTGSTLVSIDGYKSPNGDSPYRNNAVVVAAITPEYTTGYGPVDPADVPEERLVMNTETGDFTLCLPGREPLVIPAVYCMRETVEQGSTFLSPGDPDEGEGTLRYVDYDLNTIEEADFPARYILYTASTGRYRWTRSLVGGVPEGCNPETLLSMLDYGYYEYYPEDGSYKSFQATILTASSGRVRWALYSTNGQDSMMCYFDMGDTGFVPEKGKSYLLHGAFVAGLRGGQTFQVREFPNSEDDPWLELSGDDDPALTDSIFAEYAALYQMSNNTAVLTASDSIPSLEVFQQGILYLMEGRFPQAGERGVCVISGSMSESVGLGVGDTLNLEILASDPEVRAVVSSTGDRRTLEIVGVTNPQYDYADRLWVSAAEGSDASPLFGYSLGMAALENRKAVQAAEELSALIPTLVQLTLYDQGYAAAARPIQAMETAAQAITAAAACGALAVLVLFAFLFVGRQRETVGVLVSLGTPVGKIRAWLLSGAAVIAGVAALLGAFVGSLALERVTAAAMEMAEQLYSADTRYSEAAAGLIKESTGAGQVPGWPAPAAGAAVFLAALALCLVFLHHARKENTPKQGKVSVRVPKGKTSTVGRGALRFAVLSARRGGRRSVVAVAAALVLTLFVSLLAASAQGWSDQVDSLYEDSRLSGQIVNFDGRKQTGLVIPIQNVQALCKSGYMEEMAVSISWNYWLPGEMPAFAGTAFGAETKERWIAQQPLLAAVNSLSSAAEFYYTDRPEVQWLDGWDESFLADGSYPSILQGIGDDFYRTENPVSIPDYPVLVSSRFLTERGLELGDSFTVAIPIKVYLNGGSASFDCTLDLQAVGSFVSTGAKDNLYAPLSMWCTPEWVRGDGEKDLSEREFGNFKDAAGMVRWNLYQTCFETCRFTLKSAYELEDLRCWLAEEEYSAVGITNRNRTTILLRDESFVETVGGLNRYISFSQILFPVLFLVVGLMGFILSWLTVSSRRMELAIMRGLGASQGRTFASFFLEQAALCLTGCLAGVLAMFCLYPVGAVWLAGAGFLVCYLAGCALSVVTAGRTNLMLLLSERE